MELEFLSKIPLFSGLSLNELNDLKTFSERRHYPRGNIVIFQGDTGEVIYLILKGQVKVILDHQGKEIILSTLKEGGYFGEMSVLDGQPRSATVKTISDSEFLIISRDMIKDQIQKNPELAFELLLELLLIGIP